MMKNDIEFQELVTLELSFARSAFDPIHSEHEAYGVILEEVEEFWDEVRARVFRGEKALSELIQIAAMAQRAAEDLKLMRDFGEAASRQYLKAPKSDS